MEKGARFSREKKGLFFLLRVQLTREGVSKKVSRIEGVFHPVAKS